MKVSHIDIAPRSYPVPGAEAATTAAPPTRNAIDDAAEAEAFDHAADLEDAGDGWVLPDPAMLPDGYNRNGGSEHAAARGGGQWGSANPNDSASRKGSPTTLGDPSSLPNDRGILGTC
eukprot:CCRYP_012790-RA/>CCRYP_012790-RA protein AED:0.53 eAED:1.00 QI:0/0/0/0.66/1/1/3/0/117